VLHLGPDEVIAGIRHGAISLGTVGTKYRSASHLFAFHHLDHHRIPDLGIRRRIERRPVFPFGRIEHSLIDGA
jgi:hypothetical protein